MKRLIAVIALATSMTGCAGMLHHENTQAAANYASWDNALYRCQAQYTPRDYARYVGHVNRNYSTYIQTDGELAAYKQGLIDSSKVDIDCGAVQRNFEVFISEEIQREEADARKSRAVGNALKSWGDSMQRNKPTYTNCNGGGGYMNCTTY